MINPRGSNILVGDDRVRVINLRGSNILVGDDRAFNPRGTNILVGGDRAFIFVGVTSSWESFILVGVHPRGGNILVGAAPRGSH